MSKLVRSCALVAAAAGLAALMPAASQAAQCRSFGAVGDGLNQAIASFMAKQGAINVAENRGWTVKGEAKLVKCSATGILGTECTARSYACKTAQ
jgi:hypothetical protein